VTPVFFSYRNKADSRSLWKETDPDWLDISRVGKRWNLRREKEGVICYEELGGTREVVQKVWVKFVLPRVLVLVCICTGRKVICSKQVSTIEIGSSPEFKFSTVTSEGSLNVILQLTWES
jgi:hypothetical protein